jgi:branched-chain amino acid aminotransferase
VKAWLDGELVETDHAAVSAFDHGLTVGDGVFETTKVVDGTPFALSRHLARLARSAQGLGLVVPGEAELRKAVEELLAANAGEPVGRLRLTVTGGVGPLGSDRGGASPTVVIACSPAKAWPPSTVLVTVPWPRNERSAVAGIKTTSYAENVVALAWAHDRGAAEALFLNTRGEVCEGTGSNVFAVLDGRLVTPPLSSGCLAGVTRELVIEWCGAEERVLTPEELASADEVAVSSSTRDVHPVSRLDDRLLPAPGPVTHAAIAEFSRRATEDADP